MIVLLYALATVACGALAIRAPLADRDDPVRRAYFWLGITVSVTWLGWTLYLIPGLGIGKIVNGAAAAFLPGTLLAFVHRFFAGPDTPHDRRISQLLGFAPVVAVVYTVTEFALPWRFGQAGFSDIWLGTWVFCGLSVSLWRLWQRHQASHQRVERARIRYLVGLAGGGVLASAMEAVVRALGDSGGTNSSFLAREGFVQGAFPPLGALLTTTFLYFLYQMISVYRLLDLAEIFSRVAAVSIAAAILVLLDSLSAVSLLGPYPTHGLFQAFVGSVLFLLGWDPMRKQLEQWFSGIFNPRGLELDLALREVEQQLPRAISLPDLTGTLLDHLLASGRVPFAAFYLWDGERRVYRLVAERGVRELPAVLQVSRSPFTDGFQNAEPAYLRADIERLVRRDARRADELGARLQAMVQMNAALVVPLQSGDLVLGWVALADDGDSDGFSDEEVARLARVCARASVVLENIEDFDQLKEEHRLSALGTMAAGLAHEIRNPLAGIRGAAQYLESSRQSTDGEMVRVIVDETDRLNRIVAQFLDYARELRLNVDESSASELIGATVRALQAQGLPPGVQVLEEVEADLPPLAVDGGKIRQVLHNLGQNALHAVGERGTVTFRARRGELADPRARHAAAVELSVVDDGPGIESADLDKLFVPFFTRRHDGTGLGLAISQRIVQAHHGEIDVHTTVGKGTRFDVRLPLGGALRGPRDGAEGPAA